MYGDVASDGELLLYDGFIVGWDLPLGFCEPLHRGCTLVLAFCRMFSLLRRALSLCVADAGTGGIS